MQFTRRDGMTPEEQGAVAEMGKRGQTVIREQKRLIVGHGLLKPREAERMTADRIDYTFNKHHFELCLEHKRGSPA
jgi:hypothetical protein